MPRTEKFVPADLRANRSNTSGADCEDITPPRPTIPSFCSRLLLRLLDFLEHCPSGSHAATSLAKDPHRDGQNTNELHKLADESRNQLETDVNAAATYNVQTADRAKHLQRPLVGNPG